VLGTRPHRQAGGQGSVWVVARATRYSIWPCTSAFACPARVCRLSAAARRSQGPPSPPSGCVPVTACARCYPAPVSTPSPTGGACSVCVSLLPAPVLCLKPARVSGASEKPTQSLDKPNPRSPSRLFSFGQPPRPLVSSLSSLPSPLLALSTIRSSTRATPSPLRPSTHSSSFCLQSIATASASLCLAVVVTQPTPPRLPPTHLPQSSPTACPFSTQSSDLEHHAPLGHGT